MPNYAKHLTNAHKRFLSDLFPAPDCLLSPEELVPFSSDASGERAMPWAVVRPESEEQIRELLRWANVERIPIYGRARGTGRVGSAVPDRGGIVVSLLKLNKILEVNESDFVAVTQPGVITSDLQAACAEKHLFYPPDPASVRISSIGGNVSTCAGGLKAVKYGVTRDWVLGLRAVLPGGEILTMGGHSHKDVVGLDLTRLFVGANGTLGLITEVTVKLIPMPETSASVLVGFSDLHSSLEGASAVFRAGVLPAACEFMDRITLDAIRMGDAPIPLADDAEAALLFKVDGTEAGVEAEMRQLTAALAPMKPASIEIGRGEEEERIWTVRRGISPAAFRIKPDKLAEDISVPRGKVAEAVERAHQIGEENNLTVLCFGHLGDGNIHVNVMHDAADADEVKRSHVAKEAIFRLAMELGGTISGEHGIGLTKASFVREQLPPLNRRLMDSVKAAFDPNNIMNPGKGW